MQQKALKPKRCKVCSCEFYPFNSMQKVCGVKCSIEFAKKEKRKTFDRETRQLKQELNYNDRRYQLKELQREFNAYIRERDKDLPCISCARHHGGKFDAGHYRTVAACPALRFSEDNCHKQCVPCNQHLSGNLVEYRRNLLLKIGPERLEWIEGSHPLRRYTLEEIRELRKHYRKKLREVRE